MISETQCPICKGTGIFQNPNRMQVDTVEVKRELAKKLREKGYSIRQIQQALGYKSTRSVTYLLNS